MKRQLLAAALIMGATFTTQAQDLVDKIAAGSCSCIKEVDPKMKGDELETQLGVCIVQQISLYSGDLKKQYHLTVEELNTAKGKKFAEQVGVKMAGKCPEQMMRLVSSANETKVASEGTAAGSLEEATITDIQLGQIATVIVKDGSGREHKLLWLEYFEGADLLKQGVAAVKGKAYNISYEEKELYNPTLKDYVKSKVITGIAAK